MDENEIIERRACISGVGQSEIGRRLFRDPLELTLDGCLAAIEHAGLTTADIDGLSTYPGPMGTPAGFSGAGAYDVIDALRLECGWYGSGLETSGQLGSVVNACLAVASGLANHVLCFRSVYEGSAQGDKGRSAVTMGGGGGSFKASGFTEWTLPFSAPSAVDLDRDVRAATLPQVRHDARTDGVDRVERAPQRRDQSQRDLPRPDDDGRLHGGAHDRVAVRSVRLRRSVRRLRPRSSSPGAIAPRTCRNPPLRVEAVGVRLDGRPSWDQFDDLSAMPNRGAGQQLWERTEYKPADVQMAQLYDGFSWLTMSWLEALGLCGVGESGPFIEGGTRIARDGQLPLNTHGGQLSAGRLHGYGFLHEGATQMWGEAGERQIATPPEVGIIGAGGGNTCGALLLVRE